MGEFLRTVLLLEPTTRVVVLGAGLLGVCCGVVGSLAVLRRRALLGDCVAHAALPGVCLAFMLTGGRFLPVLLVGAAVTGLFAVAFIAAVRAWTRVREDAAIGIALASFFGLGLVLLSVANRYGGGSRAGLDRFLFGQAAAMIRQDAWVIGVSAVVCCGLVALLLKEFRGLCFDREYASVQGWPVSVLDGLLMSLVCVSTVAGLPAAGVVLVSALLVIPAVTARLWASGLGWMLVVSGAVGGTSGVVGVGLSAHLPVPERAGAWPTGPMIVLSAGVALGMSLLLAPERGVLAALARRRAVRRMVSADRLHGPLDASVPGAWAGLRHEGGSAGLGSGAAAGRGGGGEGTP
ncbi:MAG: metal ABC transporter permease [Phycisphaerales bacterium]